MHYQVLIRDAIDVVVEWNLPEEVLGSAVMVQAEAMAGRCWD